MSTKSVNKQLNVSNLKEKLTSRENQLIPLNNQLNSEIPANNTTSVNIPHKYPAKTPKNVVKV